MGEEFGGDEHRGGRALKRPRVLDTDTELEPSTLLVAPTAMVAAARHYRRVTYNDVVGQFSALRSLPKRAHGTRVGSASHPARMLWFPKFGGPMDRVGRVSRVSLFWPLCRIMRDRSACPVRIGHDLMGRPAGDGLSY